MTNASKNGATIDPAGLNAYPPPARRSVIVRWPLGPEGFGTAAVNSGLANVEAVTRSALGEPQRPYLLLVEDGPEVSRYALVPVPGR